jgi:DNA-binding FrmR family transcriptional regulator
MSHISRDKKKLLNRVRRIRGQMEAIERALDDEKGCGEVLQLIAGARGAINGLMGVVIKEHIENHVADSALTPKEREEGAAELMEVVRTYLK